MAEAAAARPESERLAVHLDGFEGPLDLLLDLARAQKVDLARISILALVDQFLAVIEGARRVRLELAADWLVMAAWLAWLKSRLLLPADQRPEEAEAAGDLLALRLQSLEAIRRGAAWLGARPVLGQDVFRRGRPENQVDRDQSRLAADLAGLIRAFIAATTRAAARRPYRPAAVTYWTVAEALDRLERLVGTVPGWTLLERFLPPLPETEPLARRAAYASTLIAGLELARTGRARLEQEQAFGPILVGREA
jgi:segregation and condensation protein A